MMIFPQVAEKKCAKNRYNPHSTAKIRIVQDCVAVSPAIAEFLFETGENFVFNFIYLVNGIDANMERVEMRWKDERQ